MLDPVEPASWAPAEPHLRVEHAARCGESTDSPPCVGEPTELGYLPLLRGQRLLLATAIFAAGMLGGGFAGAQTPGDAEPAVDGPEPPPPPSALLAGLPDPEPVSVSRASPVRWHKQWKKFGLENAVITGAGLVAAVASLAIPSDEDRWTAPNDLDTAVRNALRPSTLKQQNRFRDASDVLLTISINQMLVDTLVVSWWMHERPEVAWQMALIDIETLAINTAVNTIVSGAVSRQRPYGDRCVGELGDRLDDCVRSRRYRSFFSGHTSTTFAIAGMTCMHHAYMPLYGHAAADAAFCAFGFLTAAGTGALRIVGDQHFFTDVLVGAAVGTAIGLGVPWLLHYRTGPAIPHEKSGRRSPHADGLSLDLTLVPLPTGANVVGRF